MKKLNNKGFTLVELLAVIVVLAIVMGLAVVAITGVLDNARKATFVADAKQFLEGARNLVNSADMDSMLTGGSSSTYLITCNSGTGAKNNVDITLDQIPLQQGGKKSPYGNTYAATSKIHVAAAYKDATNKTDCQFTYTIFLSDGVYAIGTASSLKEWNSITVDDVKPLAGS